MKKRGTYNRNDARSGAFASAPFLARIALAAAITACAPLQADPLLRDNWTDRERARIDGMVSRLTGALESPADRYQIPDGAGRNFYIDDRGGLHFEPLYDGDAFNWRPVVPDVRNVALYYAEADALYRRGLKDEALYLMKALRAMRGFVSAPLNSEASGASPAPATVLDRPLNATLRSAIIRESERASAWLNAKQKTDSDFQRLDGLTDPFAVYNGEAGYTLVLSNRFGWRLRLPGSWRFQRGPDRFTQAGNANRNVVYLQHNEWRIMIASDVYAPSPARLLNIKEFIREWDLRRSLTPARKRLLSFRRETGAEDLAACVAPADATELVNSTETVAKQAAFLKRRDQCALFQTGLRDRERSYSFREYYRLLAREGRGFFLQFSYNTPPELAAAEIQKAAVSAALARIVASLRFTNR